MNLKSKIIDKSFYLKNSNETFKKSTIFLDTLFEIPEIKELILSDVSKFGDYVISYKDGEGEELRVVVIAISFNEATDIFNGVYGFEITAIRKI
jgi:hypothetical protein